jgi:CPA1 family monovalent cation:H+ antiporter
VANSAIAIAVSEKFWYTGSRCLRKTFKVGDNRPMENFLQTETIFIELLLIASLVATVVQRIRLPYTVALVLVGLALTFQGTIQFDVTPELILALFLPPLLFEAAFHVEFQKLRAVLFPILTLAVPGVILGTFIVGGIVAYGTSLTLPTALVFGALIAATDPVAVIAVFRAIGVPKKLATLVEGESLFNDGAAVVLFNIVLAVALTGHFSPIEGLWEFVRVSVGGVAIGLGLGWIAAQLISRVDDYLIETTLTTVLAFGSYLLAEQFHVSGVLAVVAAGILNGNIGPKGMSPSTKIVLFNFWEYLAFLANSLIFLLIGLEIELPLLAENVGPIIVAVVSVWLARIISVYGLSWIIGHFRGGKIPIRWQHVLTWGGLRGAVSLALALGLPAALGTDRSVILAMTFGVVLITLLVQATTIEPLLKRLKLVGRPQAELEYERSRGKLLSLRTAQEHLTEMYQRGELSEHAWSVLEPEMKNAGRDATDQLRELVQTDPLLEEKEITSARRELLVAQRGALYSLQHDGLIDGEVFEVLATEIDHQLERLEDEEISTFSQKVGVDSETVM